MENVFMTTTERKRMSTKTTFKRIALVAVASLGLGILSVVPSTAAVSSETFTATADATSINVGDSVTITVANEFTSSASDTTVIGVSVSTSSGGSTTNYIRANSDTVNALASGGLSAVANWDTFTSGSGVAKFNRISATIYLQNFTAAGTYYVSVYSTGADGVAVARKSASLTITVARPTISSVRLYTSTDTATAQNARRISGPAVDSTVAVSAGSAATPVWAANIFATGLAAGDTLTAAGSNVCTAQLLGYCSVTVSVSGPGLVSLNNGTPSKAATMTLYNGSGFGAAGETLSVYSDGTSGVGTITFSSGTTTYATKTVTFYGAAASATLNYGDTIINGTTSGALKAFVKDAGGNTFTGDIYVYSSDTSVISESATACSYDSTLGYHSCALTVVETGTATVKVSNRSAQSAAATTSALAAWFSSTLSYTVRGTKIQSFTATFDKATYAPGEKAILTITAKDRAGNSMANGSISNAFTVTSNKSFTDAASSTTFAPGTSGLEDGIETRVVYMPTIAGTFELSLGYGAGSWTKNAAGTELAAVKATATVVDATKDAADAATDAALEATDAAYAAQDAAQLAAEAAGDLKLHHADVCRNGFTIRTPS